MQPETLPATALARNTSHFQHSAVTSVKIVLTGMLFTAWSTDKIEATKVSSEPAVIGASAFWSWA